jgi:CBS domain-containing protein
MKIQDVYRHQVATCAPTARLRDAALRMEQSDSGIVVIVEGRRVAAVLTERDIVRAVAHGIDPRSPVVEHAAFDVLTARLDDDTSDVAHRMIQAGVRRFPVVDDAVQLVGVVSMRDLFIVETLMPSETAHERERELVSSNGRAAQQ